MRRHLRTIGRVGAALAVAACAPQSSSGGDRRLGQLRRRQRLLARGPEDAEAGHPDDRHRQAGLRAVVRRRQARAAARASSPPSPTPSPSKLGYAKDQVTWTRVRSTPRSQPGPKAFDFDINQFSITEERKKAVDFSSPYYTVARRSSRLKASKIDGATSVADLKAPSSAPRSARPATRRSPT